MRFSKCTLSLLFVLPFGLYAQVRPFAWEFSDGGRGDDVFKRATQLSQGFIAFAETQSTAEPGKPLGQVLLLDFSSGKIAARLPLNAAPSVVLNDIAEHPDGNLLLAGQSPGKSGPMPWLAKMGRDGKLLWQKTPSDLGVTAFTQLALGFDNRLVMSGTGRDGSLHLFACDTAGTPLWKKQWPAAELGPLRRFTTGPKGTICLIGQTVKTPTQSPDDAWVLLLDAGGKELWRKTFGDKLYEDVSEVAILADGSVLFCGESNSAGNGKLDMWLVRLNASGFKQWEKYYGGREEDRATALLPLHNGNILLAGQTLSLLNKKGATKFAARLAEFSSGGELQWEDDYGGDNDENFQSLWQIHDGSLLAAGWSESIGKGGKDAWAMLFTGVPVNRLLAKGTLQIENSKVWLNTADGVLRPGGRSFLSFELTNQETSRLDNIRVDVKMLDGQQALQIEPSFFSQPLFPGIPRSIHIPVQADLTLDTKDNILQIDVFSGPDKVKTFNASFKSLNPKASVLRVAQIQTAREGADAQSPQSLTVDIQNDGDLPAAGVQVAFTIPKGILALNGQSIAVGNIPAKAAGKAVFRFQKTVQYEGDEVLIQCEVRDASGNSARKDVTVRLDALVSGQRADFIVFTQPNEARTKKIDWNAPTYNLEATFGTTTNALKPGDAVTKINGVASNQAKMDEEELSPPTARGNLNYYAYANTIALREGENRVLIEVKTPYGVIQSNEVVINYRPKQPNLHVLSIGIPHRDLKYTTLDAENFAAAFAEQAGPDKVFGKVYVEKKNGKENTRNLDIRAAMEDLRRRYASESIPGKITRDDVLILFLSSHGKTDDNNDFKILASDYDQYGDVSNIDYKRDILDVLNAIDCKKFVFIDACHSGSAEGARLLSQARFALEEINAAYPGLNVMTSSQVDELSYEDDTWRNGAFTEAILEAFKGQPVAQGSTALSADTDGDKILRFGELYDFLKKRVPNLVMEKKKSRQMPVKMSKGLGDNIPIFVLY